MSKLVIGGGYLGIRIARRWRSSGERVFVTSRKPDRRAVLAGMGFEPIDFDVLNPTPLPVVEGVVHCVGLDRGSGVTMRQVYVDGLANVLAMLPGSPRFVHVSSTSVYGQSQGEEVDESAATNPVEESGQIVLEAERLLRDKNPEAVILRFAGIYGPGRLLRETILRAGEPIATHPDKWLNLIHVEDGATAVVAAEAYARAGAIYNVVDDRPVRRRDFYRWLAHLLGAPVPRFVAPPDPPGPHEIANRRVVNLRLRQELRVHLSYPDYEVGLAASVGGS